MMLLSFFKKIGSSPLLTNTFFEQNISCIELEMTKTSSKKAQQNVTRSITKTLNEESDLSYTQHI